MIITTVRATPKVFKNHLPCARLCSKHFTWFNSPVSSSQLKYLQATHEETKSQDQRSLRKVQNAGGWEPDPSPVGPGLEHFPPRLG